MLRVGASVVEVDSDTEIMAVLETTARVGVSVTEVESETVGDTVMKIEDGPPISQVKVD